MNRLTYHWSPGGTELHPGADPNQCADCRTNLRWSCCGHCEPAMHKVIPQNEHTTPCSHCQEGGAA